MLATDSTVKDLGELSTHWSMVLAAHCREAPEALRIAQERLLKRYDRAIRLYVRSAVPDADAVDDLCQNFATRFVKGDFRKADPGKGRFRDYLKSSLFNLVRDYYKDRRRFPTSLPEDYPEPGIDDPPSAHDDKVFLDCWRDELMRRAWEALRDYESDSGRPTHALLEYFVTHPKARSADAAAHFALRYGQPISPDQIRKWRMNARDRLRDFVIREVERSLEHPSLDAVEDELVELGLLEFFRDTITRRRGA